MWVTLAVSPVVQLRVRAAEVYGIHLQTMPVLAMQGSIEAPLGRSVRRARKVVVEVDGVGAGRVTHFEETRIERGEQHRHV